MNRALIIGAGGQDGSYLSGLLANKGWSVDGMRRGDLDLSDGAAVAARLAESAPDHVYYLAAHNLSAEMEAPDDATQYKRCQIVHAEGLMHFLDAVASLMPETRVFYAGSSHVFGDPVDCPQSETTPFSPRCLYGITKAAGLTLCRFFRETRGVFVSSGILYNHESPLRGPRFLLRKIVTAAVAIRDGRQDTLTVSDLDASADWGFAGDYAEAMHEILKLDSPDDFIIATGELHAVREAVEVAFQSVGLDWEKHVRVDPSIIRRGRERQRTLQGDAAHLAERSGWRPKTSFAALIQLMVAAEQANPSSL